MQYLEENNSVVVYNLDSFNISEVLDCGQCFRFTKLADSEYIIIAHERVIKVLQEKDKIIISPCTIKEFEEIWLNYFDLKTSYKEIKEILAQSDETLKEAINFAEGIRILHQDRFECLISFIISQNNRIPMIKQVIKNLSEFFGEDLNNSYYSFPTAETLAKLTQEELMACKTGFRHKYISDAAKKCVSGEINLENFDNVSTEELRKTLMSIYGVGNKVADCVMLFSCNRREVFPTDVWVKRVMQYYYFNNLDVSIKEIDAFAKEKWGNLAGFAQQYLFHFARTQKIGVK
ncbi:MAG: hypothetical protein FWD82_03940 [Defluviitaleaceae bacterium]|nr:hypothetical protein [Defluviitaleaceae bacterium]